MDFCSIRPFRRSPRGCVSSILHNRSCAKSRSSHVEPGIGTRKRRRDMKRSTIAGALAMIAMAPLSATAMPHGALSYEERLAAMQDDMTLTAPLPGVQHKYWVNYS